MPDIVILSDRIKEHSRTTGTGNLELEGAAAGFSAFGEFYSHGDILYYAVTDGSNYEVGSGIYHVASSNELRRFPFTSKGPGSTGTEAVNWGAGLKEIYVTYPAAKSVYTASGVDPSYSAPEASGLAFWESSSILNYDSSIVWDRANSRLGINNTEPLHAVDIGGGEHYSQVRASGFIAGSSGVTFPSGNTVAAYLGGMQLEHFVRNEVNSHTGSDEVIELSGVVDNIIRLKQQVKGHVFAGPPSGCGVGCSPAYPTFRYLTLEDFPDLSSQYAAHQGTASAGYVTIWNSSTEIGHDTSLFFNTTSDRLGIGTASPNATLHVAGDAQIDGNLDVRGTTTYINSNNVTIGDKAIELASLSGTPLASDSQIESAGGAGFIVKSTDLDKSFLWRSGVVGDPGHWTTDSWVKTSGITFLWNDSKISGAYEAGSGLTLHGGVKFDMGNMFKAGVNETDVSDVHVDHTVIVSGISGVAASLSSTANQHIILIDPSELSGILQNSAGGFTLFDGGGSSQDIAAKDTVRLLEGGGLNVAYTDSTGPDYAITFTAENIDTTHINSSTLVVASEVTEFLPNSDTQIPTSAAISGVIPVAGSGLIKHSDNTFNLTNPSGLYPELAAAASVSGDYVLVWDGCESDSNDDIIAGIGKWTIMQLSELQKKIDTAGAGGGGASWTTIDVNDLDSGFVWGTSDVTAASAGESVKFVAGGDMEIESQNTPDAVRFTNTGSPIVSGMLDIVSGITHFNSGEWVTGSGNLQSQINTNNIVYNAGSGLVKHGSSSPYTFVLNDPTVSYSSLDDTAAVAGSDKVLVWDHSSSVWKHMVFSEIQDLIVDTAMGTASDTFRDFDIANGDAVSPTWSTTEVVVAANSSDKINLFAGTGMLLESDNDTSAIRFSNIGAATVSGMLIDASGALDTRITTNTTNISSNVTNITTVSGMLDSASGTLNTDIQTVSGLSVPTGSQSGLLVFNNDQAIVDTYLNGSGLVWDSGNGALIIGASGDYVVAEKNSALFVDANIPTRKGVVVQAAYQQSVNLFETRGVDGSQSGIYIDQHGDLVGRDGYHGNAEFFAGRCAGEYATSAGGSIFIGEDAGQISHDVGHSVVIGRQAAKSASGVDDSIIIGQKAGFELYSKDSLGSAIDSPAIVAIGQNAMQEASGNSKVTSIGYQAGKLALNNVDGNFIGNNAGASSSGNNQSNFIGDYAGHEATGCTDLNAMGYQAGMSADMSSNSSMIGYQAGYHATGCDYSNIIGYKAGYEGSGIYSNIMGYEAGMDASTVQYSDYIGYRAGVGSDDTSKLIAIGYEAGTLATGVTHSVLLGRKAGYSTDYCGHINAIGYQAVENATGCYSSTMIGGNAGRNSKELGSGVFLGEGAGAEATGIAHSLSFGLNSMTFAKDLTGCNVIGHLAGQSADTCFYSSMIGYGAGGSATTIQSVLIGHYAGVAATGTTINAIGSYAGSTVTKGINDLPPDGLNAIGLSAGHYSQAAPDAVFIGSYAGYQSAEQMKTVAIGYQAGLNSSATIDGAAPAGTYRLFTGHADNSNNVYVGQGAGKDWRGSYNIHIVAGQDDLPATYVPGNVGYGGINIGNVIFGQGYPQNTRGIQIGDTVAGSEAVLPNSSNNVGNMDTVGCTLAVKSRLLQISKPLMILKRQSGQSGPLLQVELGSYNNHGGSYNTSSPTQYATLVNSNGLPCMPIFNRKEDLPPAGDNEGACVLVRTGSSGEPAEHVFAIDGKWHYSGTATGSFYDN